MLVLPRARISMFFVLNDTHEELTVGFSRLWFLLSLELLCFLRSLLPQSKLFHDNVLCGLDHGKEEEEGTSSTSILPQ